MRLAPHVLLLSCVAHVQHALGALVFLSAVILKARERAAPSQRRDRKGSRDALKDESKLLSDRDSPRRSSSEGGDGDTWGVRNSVLV